MRYGLFDGMRGYFLVFMLVNHVQFVGGNAIAKINHQNLGYVQDAQGFIFLSGLIVGLHYTQLLARHGFRPFARKLLGRVWLLYKHSALLIAGVFSLALCVPIAYQAWSKHLQDLIARPVATSVGALLLVHQPFILDILPQYMLYMVVAIGVLPFALAGKGQIVVATSLMIWLLAQVFERFHFPVGLEAAFARLGIDIALRSAFNPFAWQIVFFPGLVLGASVATGRIAPRDWVARYAGIGLPISVLLLAVFLGFRIGISLGLLSEATIASFNRLAVRDSFGLVYLVNFAAASYAVAWALMHGEQSSRWLARTPARILRKLFELPALRFLGQHSLHVYTFHVAVVYLLLVLDDQLGPFGHVSKAAMTLCAVASLFLPALWHARASAIRRQRAEERAGVPDRSDHLVPHVEGGGQ